MAALTFLTFLPCLQNDFVGIDDDEDLVNNIRWRGFSWVHLQWIFSQHKGDYYRPLSWVSHGLDYCLWGMDPFGHHLTSLLIHVANAVLFFFVCKRLIALALPVNGTPIPEVSSMLGHANVNITLTVYTHFIPKMQTDSSSRLAAAIFSGGKTGVPQEGKSCGSL